MEVNFHNKCRACLSENDAMLSLFEVYEHDLTLAIILQSCILAEVSEIDGLPSHLCESCTTVLIQFYNFTMVYEESDQKLKKLLKDSKKHIPVNQSGELAENLENLVEAAEPEEEVETNELLNEMVAAEVSQEEVMTNCSVPATLEYDEYETSSNGCEEQEGMDVPNYSLEEVETIREFKKEVPEETEGMNGDRDYIPPADMLIKTKGVKDENVKYEEITKYECGACEESHLYSTGFQQHMRVAHGMSNINCEEYASQIKIKVYKVDGIAPASSSVPEEDLEVYHSGATTQKCKYCSKEFFPIQLQHHIKLHEGNKKYMCEVCGARFIRKTCLNNHMEGHGTEKKHECNFCGKAFRLQTVLRAHKRVHTHPNHYVCEQCGRAFTKSSTLKTHKLLIHVKARNFHCVICNLAFPLKTTLNKHVLRHQKRESGEKGFNCTQCEMQYRDKSSLKWHVNRKHQGLIQLLGCPDCSKKYTSKGNLMKHRRRHHSTTAVEIVL